MNTQDPHGRQATHPSQIPARGWRDVLWRVWHEVQSDNLGLLAAGVAFYMLLVLFPLLAAAVSLWGLFADASHLDLLVTLLDAGIAPAAAQFIAAEFSQLQAVDRTQLTGAAVLGILIGVWSARRAVLAMMMALNIVYEESEHRSWWKRTALSIVLAAGMLIFFIFSMAGVVVSGLLPELVEWYGWAERLLQVCIWGVLALSFIYALAVMYRYGPSRENARWRWLTPGAHLATLLWLLCSIGFSVYVENFARYEESYGALAGVIILMVWFFLVTLSVLVGAELNSELEHQTARDSTTGAPQPMGERGAFVADHLGETPADSS